MSNAYIMYNREKVFVTVDGYFNNGTMANVTAIEGYPFLSQDVESQGDTFGAWNCNGRRVRTDFIMIEPHPVEEAYRIESEIDERIDTGLITSNDHYRPATMGDEDKIPF